MASNLATGAKVSSKSKHFICEKPCATNLALFLTTTPSLLCLFLKTHFVPVIEWLGGGGISFQTLFC
jgi:hypothetical protein